MNGRLHGSVMSDTPLSMWLGCRGGGAGELETDNILAGAGFTTGGGSTGAGAGTGVGAGVATGANIVVPGMYEAFG